MLDEADEMLDMGFAEDIEAILQSAPEPRQTVLFSATMPPRLGRIIERHLQRPGADRDRPRGGGRRDRRRSSGRPPTSSPRQNKPAALGRLLDIESPTAALVFCRRRDEVDQLTETLNGRGYRAEALHGGMTQEQRDRVMGRLRGGHADLLIATDVAARGLDIDQLTHVINYDVPAAPEAYVHRIGRVGRAGREGVAITLAQPREHRMLKTIERVTKQPIKIEKIPTVADLRARRLELTRAGLEESLLEDRLDPFRVVVETLVGRVRRDGHRRGRGQARPRARPAGRSTRRRSRRSRRRRRARARRSARSARRASDMTRLFVGVGRVAGIRPQDLVGAITDESGVSGRDIGAIEIPDRFSLVEVPEDAAEHVIRTLRATTIKGRRANVRRERFERKP